MIPKGPFQPLSLGTPLGSCIYLSLTACFLLNNVRCCLIEGQVSMLLVQQRYGEIRRVVRHCSGCDTTTPPHPPARPYRGAQGHPSASGLRPITSPGVPSAGGGGGYPAAASPLRPPRGRSPPLPRLPRTASPSLLPNGRRTRRHRDERRSPLPEPRSLRAAAAPRLASAPRRLGSLSAGAAARAPRPTGGAREARERAPGRSSTGQGAGEPGGGEARPPSLTAARHGGASGTGAAGLPLLAAGGSARGGGRGARPALPGPRRRRSAVGSASQAAAAVRPSPCLPASPAGELRQPGDPLLRGPPPPLRSLPSFLPSRL